MLSNKEYLLKRAFHEYQSYAVPQNYQNSAVDTAISLGVPLALTGGALAVGGLGALGKKVISKGKKVVSRAVSKVSPKKLDPAKVQKITQSVVDKHLNAMNASRQAVSSNLEAINKANALMPPGAGKIDTSSLQTRIPSPTNPADATVVLPTPGKLSPPPGASAAIPTAPQAAPQVKTAPGKPVTAPGAAAPQAQATSQAIPSPGKLSPPPGASSAIPTAPQATTVAKPNPGKLSPPSAAIPTAPQVQTAPQVKAASVATHLKMGSPIKVPNFGATSLNIASGIPKTPSVAGGVPTLRAPKIKPIPQPTAPKGLNTQIIPQNVSPVQLPSPSVQISPSSSPTQMSSMTGSGQAAPNLSPKVAAWYGGGFGVVNAHDSTLTSIPYTQEERSAGAAPDPLTDSSERPRASRNRATVQRTIHSYLNPAVARPNALLQTSSYLNKVFLDSPRTDYATPEQRDMLDNMMASEPVEQQEIQQKQNPEQTTGQEMVPGAVKQASWWHDPVDVAGLGLLAAPHIYSSVHTPSEKDNESAMHSLMTSEKGKRALELLGLAAIAAGPLQNTIKLIRNRAAGAVPVSAGSY